MGKFLRWMWSGIAHASQAWQLWVWLVPAGVTPAMTAYLADAANAPGYLLFLAALGAFCLTSLGIAAIFNALLRQNEWRHRTEIEGKLDYLQPHFGFDVHWSSEGVAEFIDKMNVGIQLRNRALETIYYKVDFFHALVEGRGPNTDKYVGHIFSVPSQSTSRSHPDAIAIGDLRKPEIAGTMEFELRYGRKDDMRYSIKQRQRFECVLHPEASVKPLSNIGVSVLDKV